MALDLSRIDPWGKIAPGIAYDATLDGGNAGWHALMHLGIFYLNVPQSDGVLSKQYVLNTRTGAWTTYTGWNPSTLCSHNNSLYIGAVNGGLVNLVGGLGDDGDDITAYANGAFTYPSSAQLTNVFTGIRPKMQADGTVYGVLGVDTDFVVRTLKGVTVPIINDVSSTPWGSDWGSPWGASGESRPLWFSIRGEGKAVSVRMRASGATSNFRWYATDLLFKPGGIR